MITKENLQGVINFCKIRSIVFDEEAIKKQIEENNIDTEIIKKIMVTLVANNNIFLRPMFKTIRENCEKQYTTILIQQEVEKILNTET